MSFWFLVFDFMKRFLLFSFAVALLALAGWLWINSEPAKELFLEVHYSVRVVVVVSLSGMVCWAVWDWIVGFFRWLWECVCDLFGF